MHLYLEEYVRPLVPRGGCVNGIPSRGKLVLLPSSGLYCSTGPSSSDVSSPSASDEVSAVPSSVSSLSAVSSPSTSSSTNSSPFSFFQSSFASNSPPCFTRQHRATFSLSPSRRIFELSVVLRRGSSSLLSRRNSAREISGCISRGFLS